MDITEFLNGYRASLAEEEANSNENWNRSFMEKRGYNYGNGYDDAVWGTDDYPNDWESGQ